MIQIPISDIKDNDVLVKAIKEKNGSIILPEGTKLKREYIVLLEELNINEVSIDEPGEEKAGNTSEYLIGRIRTLYETHIYQNRRKLAEFTKLADEAIENFKNRGIPDEISGKENMYEEIYLTAAMAYEMGENQKLSRKQMYDMVLGTLLMDIGTRYLVFPIGRKLQLAHLTTDEMNEYLKHPIIGYTILEKEEWISEEARKVILFHHEREDGSGFPTRRKIQDPIQKIVGQAVIYINSLCSTE